MFELVFFPLYGCTVGINYWNSGMDQWPEWMDVQEEEEEQHMLQFFCFIFGFSVIWYR
jgi:ferritin